MLSSEIILILFIKQMLILFFFLDDASTPSPEEFSDPCLAEFPVASLLKSAAATLSQSLCLSFVIIAYFIVTLSDLFQEEKVII